MNKNKAKFGIKIDKCPHGWWSFGVCFSHATFEEYDGGELHETYLYINFFNRSISIGFMM